MDEAGTERHKIRISPRESGRNSHPLGEQAVRMPRFVRDIQPITDVVRLKTREDLKRIVESPLLPVAQLLYDLNIETTDSSANYQDVEGRDRSARLTINFDSLSPENQQIVLAILGEPYQGRRSGIPGIPSRREVQIRVPLTYDSTEQEVAQKALELARKLKKQPMTWAQTFTPVDVVGHESDYYYDKESDQYYLSKEQYLKAKGLSFKVESK